MRVEGDDVFVELPPEKEMKAGPAYPALRRCLCVNETDSAFPNPGASI